MERFISKSLEGWKQNTNRKPLILRGARQIGKTWSLKEFGKTQYEEKGFTCHYIDFLKSNRLHTIFQESSDPKEIITLLEFYLKTSINPAQDLLIFDEIQECPEAVTALKYFSQDLRKLDLIAAGSHIGLMHNSQAFPVGKVNFLSMYPLSFGEFVHTLDPDAYKYLAYSSCLSPFPTIVHERLLELFQLYSIIGGLPEAVLAFSAHFPSDIRKGVTAARSVQHELTVGYRADFSKYSGKVNAMHINYVFDAVPGQLSQAYHETVDKFRFKDVIPGRRGLNALRGPVTWLIESGLCIRNSIAKKGVHPLASYCDENKFKLFLFDVGLLNAMLHIPGEAILGESLGPYKGYLLENYVAQELRAQTSGELYSWAEGTAEIEFIYPCNEAVIPVEVKSAARSRRSKSLDAYIQKYDPPVAVKLSRKNAGFNRDRNIWSLPVYLSYRLIPLLHSFCSRA